MRVLVTSNMYPSQEDPTYGTFVRIFCEGLERHGIVVDRVVLRGRSGLFSKLAKYLRFAFDLARCYLFGRQEVVYVHYILHLAPFLLPLHALRRRRLILNVHGGDILPQNTFHRMLFPFARRLSRRADAVVVPSEFFRDVALRQLGIESERIRVWGSSGVDLNSFTPGERRKQDLTRPLELLCVGRLDPRKGWSVLLHALSLLAKRGTLPFRLTLVGHGSPSEQEALRVKLGDLGLEEHCVYTGACTHDQLPQRLQAADLFVFPTLYEESLGLVALEAMACGLPVVGSRIGALPEYVVEGRTGFLFNPGDAGALASALTLAASILEERGVELRRACVEMAYRYERSSLEVEMCTWLNGLSESLREAKS